MDSVALKTCGYAGGTSAEKYLKPRDSWNSVVFKGDWQMLSPGHFCFKNLWSKRIRERQCPFFWGGGIYETSMEEVHFTYLNVTKFVHPLLIIY